MTGRSVMRIDPGAGRRALHGMFFGAAAIAQGIEYCKRNIHTLGLRGEIGPAVTMARFVIAMARGEREIVAPVPITVAVDDGPAASFDCEIVHVTTLEELVLGLRPYWGKEAAPLHYASVRAAPAALGSGAARTPARASQSLRHVENGYDSRNAHRVDHRARHAVLRRWRDLFPVGRHAARAHRRRHRGVRDAAMNSPLDDAIESHLAAPAPEAVIALGDCLRQRFGSHALAILFYGSCRRARDDADGIVDLYVLVDGYREAYGRLLPAAREPAARAERLLPGDTVAPDAIARAKYAVVSLDQFERGTARWFHSYLWGRFAQPCGLLFAADETVRERVVRAIGAAVATFATRTLPRLPDTFDSETLWTQGLLLTYAAELRAEQPERIRARYAEAASEFDALTHAVASRLGWQARCVRALSQRQHRRRAPGERRRLDRAQAAGQGAQRRAPPEGVVHVRWRTAVPRVEDRAPLRSRRSRSRRSCADFRDWERSARCGGRGVAADFGRRSPKPSLASTSDRRSMRLSSLVGATR